MRKDDPIYKETANAVRESKIDVYDLYQKNGRVPKLANTNFVVMRRSLEQLENELTDKDPRKGKDISTSLMLAELISNNLV